jgi:two-component system response regulator FlrC
MGGLRALEELLKADPEAVVVMVTAYATFDTAIGAWERGAAGCIRKPFQNEQILDTVASGIKRRRKEEERQNLRRAMSRSVERGSIIGRSEKMQAIFSLVDQVAPARSTVLITGESGTGKEVYARFIRDHSSRADKPFVAINCAAIPENMLEATLFGYEKGAFTGALSAHAGKFEQAQGGTLLLDEISEMDLGLQAKILRVLQEREVERLGSTRTINLDVRLIATSNRNLAEEARAGRFRADLYYRLNVMSLRLSALRERPADILPLARRAIQACARASQVSLTLSPDAEIKLLQHDWPGNARELTNIVQRAAWLAAGGQINAADIDVGALGDVPALAAAVAAGIPASPGAPQEIGLDHDLKERERELILATLRVTGGSRKLAAERLGISPRTLRHKLQQLKAAGVSVPRLHDSQFAA